MPKNLKLSLADIRVQSFITGLDDDIIKKMNGGTDDDITKTMLPCPTPQTACGVTSPCQTNCTPPPQAC